jgi:hypothetical protein
MNHEPPRRRAIADDVLLTISEAAAILRSLIAPLRCWRTAASAGAASRSADASSTGAARSTAGDASRQRLQPYPESLTDRPEPSPQPLPCPTGTKKSHSWPVS